MIVVRPAPTAIAALAVAASLTGVRSAQAPPPGVPPVRIDVLVEQDGRAVTDLTQADFEVLEDNVPQPLSSFELIRPPSDAPASGGASIAGIGPAGRDARRFVLFLDTLHARPQGTS
ncbi:MAG: hypothetical protein AB7O28_19615, partial [Vicinamibacterales bacterium]